MFKDPVVGERFFGRSDILAVLDKRLDALRQGYRQNIAITGHRLTGKSSVLNQFLTSLRNSDIIPVYIEVAREPFRHFAKKFIGTILYNYLRYSGKEAKDEFEYLLKECRPHIPETTGLIEKILKDLARGDNERAYSELLNLSSALKAEAKKPCVVILDEFHNLSELGLKQPYKGFGRKIMTQKDTMYIVASSEVKAIKRILSEKLALLFGNFEQITLGGFDHATSRNFLSRKLAAVKMPPMLTDFVITFADGHPFYLDVISTKITDIMGGAKALWVSKGAVAAAMEELLFNSSGIINQFFNNFLNSVLDQRPQLARDILAAVAYGNHGIRGIARWIGTTPKNVSGQILYLIERNLLSRCGSFYLFHDKVLEFWLKEVSYKRKRTLIDDMAEQSRGFTELIKSMINDFEAESYKPFDTRLIELMRAFNNERVEIDSKVHSLPRFDSVELMDDPRGTYILGRYGGKALLAQIRQESVNENHLLDFLGVCHAYRDSLARKILIPLVGMDSNAKLMAKESRVWIWELDGFNMVLGLFGKKKIVTVNTP